MTTPAPTDHPAATGLGEPVIPARDHQPDLLAQVVAELQPAPGKPIPPDGLRVTLAAAPGTGKTWISREAARHLAPNRRVLVMAHTVDLLIQTIAWWRKAGHTEPAIAVCEAKGSEELKRLDVRATTSAPRLALWGGSGPVTVFATYASVAPRSERGQKVPGPLEEALAGTYGQQLAPFDLAVFDEAHRTAGALDKAWGAVHDNTRIPADRRLYMTATPRLYRLNRNEDDEQQGVGAGELLATMDDEAIFGRHVVFGLLEAIERGILARFEIDVLEVRDPAAEPGLPDEVAGERRLAALQAALLTHWNDSSIRSVLTFHNLTRDAMRFARGLHATADDLHESDPGRYPDPVHVSAEWLSGEHAPDHRREVVRQFADGLDDQGNTTGMSFLASCRVLGEGIDITGRRGVESVVFADTRGSVVDVVQNVGRALRQQPGEGKIARIIVPVFLAPDEDPQEMMTSPAYRSLVAILQALRAYEDKITEKLVLRQPATGRGKADEVLIDDPLYVRDPGSGETDTGDEDEDHGEDGEDSQDEGGGMPGDGPLLRFFAPRDSVAVARFVRTRVLQPESEVWLTGYQHLCRWAEEHQDAKDPTHVPQKEIVPHRRSRGGRGRAADAAGSSSGAEVEGYPLGRWRTEQLRARSNGTLKAWRFQLLDELGMVWDAADARFEEKVAVYRRYVARFHTLAAPLNAVFEGVPVGRDLANLRKPGGLGKKAERAARRQALLEDVDPDWRPDWPLAWQRCWAKVRWCLKEAGAELAELQPGVTVDGEDIGAWIAEQQHSWGALSPAQRDRLTGLGIHAPAGALPSGARLALEAGTAAGGGQSGAADSAADAEAVSGASGGETGAGAAGPALLPHTASGWERSMAALRQYREREGHVRVPRGHREVIHIDHRGDGGETAGAAGGDVDASQVREEHVRLGVFRSNTRARRDKLTPAQRQEAEEVGLLG